MCLGRLIMVAQLPTTPQDDLSQKLAPTVNNREMLQQLEKERESLSAQCLLLGTGMILGMAFWNSGMALALAPLAVLVKRLQKVSQLIKIVGDILDKFESLGVELFIRLDVPNYQPIDLFVKFPTKDFVLLSIRSLGDCKIVYNEKTKALYAKRQKGKGLRQWKPDPINELCEQEFWLRKYRRDLFGGSSKDSRRPLAKILVLWQLTKVANHAEHLYAIMDGQKFLCIRNKGTVSIIPSEKIINFIEAYLAHMKMPKTDERTPESGTDKSKTLSN